MISPQSLFNRLFGSSRGHSLCRTGAAVAVLGSLLAPWALAETVQIPLERLGDEPGYVLKTVRSERNMFFNRPTNVTVTDKSVVKLIMQHSPTLLPQRSFLSVLLNNRIIETIRLTPENTKTNAVTIPLKPEFFKPENKLTFLVDQHYTNECEDPFSADLWTTVLPETQVDLDYTPNPLQPELARFPFPLIDDHGLKPPQIYLYLGDNPGQVSDKSLEAMSVLSARLGQYLQWKPGRIDLVGQGSLPNENVILIGTPQENSFISSLIGASGIKVSGNQFSTPSGHAIPAEQGVLALVPHPQAPGKGILIVTGANPQAVSTAAHFIAQEPTRKLLSGPYGVVKNYVPGQESTFRHWPSFIQQPGETTLATLGHKTESTRGFAAVPIFYNVRKMPDVFLPAKSKVKLKTVLSYSSQLDASQAKLEVKWNGKVLKNYPLTNPRGENLATLDLEIPATEVYTYNDLEYKFQLYPEKMDLCRFVTDAHIWGTIHNTTALTVDGELKSPVPDLGLLNDGGYPFTVYSDLSKLSFALPEAPQWRDIETLLQASTRLGRMSTPQSDINLTVFKANAINDAEKSGNNWIFIGQYKQHSLMDDVNGRLPLLMKPSKERDISRVQYDPSMGLLEMVVSPWNPERMILLITGESDEAMTHSAKLFNDNAWFAAIETGNLAIISETGPRTLTWLKRGDARFARPEDYSQTAGWPVWIWWVLGAFAVLGGLSLLTWIFRAFTRR